MEEAGRSDKRRNSRSRDVAPPLPPSDGKKDSKAQQGFGQGMGPPVGFQGGFGPMNPYAMGFPPQGMPPYGGPGYPRPLAAEVHNGGRGPRPFQNRKWVNPNVAKAEEARADEDKAAADSGGCEASGVPQNTGAPAFAPRNPYYSSQMRPRFQNKTWVRQDPAKDEELNSSLPKTPPKELLESME
uniref:Uncharacterized protein n=1 Tax=Hyaloperonospora arabidopsidis (strain Emoy2) TaxID=559515 RepID=M4C4M2_HYAAE